MMRKFALILMLVLPTLLSWEWYVHNQTVSVEYGEIAKFDFVVESRTWVRLPVNISGDISVIYPEYIEVVGKKNVTLLVPTKNLVPGEYAFNVSIGGKEKTIYLRVKDASGKLSVYSVYAKVTGVVGDEIKLPLVIVNNGDFALDNVRVTAHLGKYSFSTEPFKVNASSTVDVSVPIKIPENLRSGTYTLNIEVISPQARKTITLPLEVKDKYFVRNIQANVSNVEVKNGTYFITLVIRNKNSVSVRELRLDVTSGKQTKHFLVSLLPLETKEYVVTVESPEENILVLLHYEDKVILEKEINVQKQQRTGLTGLFVLTEGQITSVLTVLGVILVALVFYSIGKRGAEQKSKRTTSLDYIHQYIEEARKEQKEQ